MVVEFLTYVPSVHRCISVPSTLACHCAHPHAPQPLAPLPNPHSRPLFRARYVSVVPGQLPAYHHGPRHGWCALGRLRVQGSQGLQELFNPGGCFRCFHRCFCHHRNQQLVRARCTFWLVFAFLFLHAVFGRMLSLTTFVFVLLRSEAFVVPPNPHCASGVWGQPSPCPPP